MIREEFGTRGTRPEPYEKELLARVCKKLSEAESNIAKGKVSNARDSLQTLKAKHG